MPGFDKTGPDGEGLLTGRGLGPCGRGLAFRGFRRGFGAGRFRFRKFAQLAITETEEKQILQEELTVLKEEMRKIEARLKKLDKSKTNK